MALRPTPDQHAMPPQWDGGAAAPASTLSIKARIREEQLRMVWVHARPAVLTATAFAIVLAVALRGSMASAALVNGWLAVKLLVSGIRMVQGHRYAAQVRPGAKWTRLTLAALIADASVWGAAGLYVTYTAAWPLASFFGAVMACLACVATFGLQVSARFTVCYAAPILAPSALGLILRGEAFGLLGGVGLLLLLVLQAATATRSQKRVAESIELRLQAEALAQEKADALKAAMRESAVRTQFLANISHELRTPLHGILGMASLLQPALKDATLARRVELISSSGQHLLSLINDLLDISRIDAGQFLIRDEAHDLAAQIEQIAGIYALRCEDKGLSFTLRDTLPKPCWVTGDPARFRQVLHNLLGNAVKFTQQGGVTLTVQRDAATGLVRAEVHDTGPGIAQADLSKVFEAFHQSGSGAIAQPSEGAGLGLTIARDIARAMGGDVVAFSKPGAGAVLVYTARLPDAPAPAPAVSAATPAPALATAAASLAASSAALPVAAAHQHQARPPSPQPSTPPREPAPLPATAQPFLPSCRVLLVEDNDINALVASNFLEIIGVQTERVKDGQEAVQAVMREGQRPDLVLMDCQMPVMNGYDATQAIRVQEQARGLPRIPIVALTATATDAERRDCLQAGMDDFLSKPCSLEDLRAAVKRWAPPAPQSGDASVMPAEAAPRTAESPWQMAERPASAGSVQPT